MFCANCGTRLREEDNYCTRCGNKVIPARSEAKSSSSSTPGYGAFTVPWRGGQVALGIALVGLAFLLISASLLLLDELESSLAWSAWLSSHAIGMVILITVWLLGQDDGRFSLAAIGLCRPRLSWRRSLLLTVGAVAVSLGGTAGYTLLVMPLEWDWLLPPDIPKEVIFQGAAMVWTFEALAGWTPFTEEIFFRGFVMAGLVPRWGVVGGAVGSALIFSLFHLHPGVLIPIFVTGLLLAFLYRATGSLWPPILAHAAQNAIAFTVILAGD